jgi:GNAT superfamily N-acetyltransferase
VSVPIHSGWRKTANGKISLPIPGQALAENHCVAVVGYDDTKELLLFWNSWGVGWGDKGYGYLPYEYFKRFLQDAWLLQPPLIGCRVNKEKTPGVVCLDSWLTNSLGNTCFIHDLWDLADNTRIRWCFSTTREGHLDVEEFFVRPEYRGRRVSRLLMSRLLQDSHKSGLPLRFWIPYCDLTTKTRSILPFDHLLTKNNFATKSSGVAWALYKAEPRDPAKAPEGEVSLTPPSTTQAPPSGVLELDMGLDVIKPATPFSAIEP